MEHHNFSLSDVKQLDMVGFLEKLGYSPKKIRNDDYWFLSPLRDEKTPSFKVNRKLNVWYDHGIGKGGNMVDFGILYFKCSVSELLHRLWHESNHNFSFHQPAPADEKKESDAVKIKILSEQPLTSESLLEYLKERSIPIEIGKNICREIDFELYGKKNSAIGFKNDSGGYELRNKNFKGSTSSKDSTFIDNGSESVSVFEGFFSYLSFVATSQNQTGLTNFLVLNSLAFFEKAKEKMERHHQIHLFLDRDAAGMKHTQRAISSNKKYTDRSILYQGHKDLNDWLIHQEHRQEQRRRLGRHF